MRPRLDLPAVLLMTFMCLLWGLQQVAIKLALSHGLPPALQAGLRSLCSALCLAVWIRARGGPGSVARLFVADGMILPGLLMGATFSVEFLLLYFGLSRTTASRGALFLYTSPFFVAPGVHWLVPSERLGLHQVVGLLCAFVGVAVAVLDGLRGTGGTLLGDAMVTGTAIMWGALTVAVRAVPVIRRNPPSRILMFQLLSSTPLLFLFAAWDGELHALATASWIAYATLIYQSGIVAFATYLIWYWMMTIYPASKLAAFSFLTPIFGLMAGATLLGEPVSATLIVALILVAGGLYLVNGRVKPS